MTEAVDVSVLSARVACGASGQARHVFTITNLGTKPVQVRFAVDAGSGCDPTWFQFLEKPQRVLHPRVAYQVLVESNLPSEVSPGWHEYRLLVQADTAAAPLLATGPRVASGVSPEIQSGRTVTIARRGLRQRWLQWISSLQMTLSMRLTPKVPVSVGSAPPIAQSSARPGKWVAILFLAMFAVAIVTSFHSAFLARPQEINGCTERQPKALSEWLRNFELCCGDLDTNSRPTLEACRRSKRESGVCAMPRKSTSCPAERKQV